ncbi:MULTISPECIES: hypothetical protein [Lactobacillus]|uniref:hypothetical protein n=1 Tax=Lactobacillus TaxID=1578 RepID=UPI00191C568B|nr:MULTISPECIES: hypothetical protein [Lactobacillus]
MSKFDAFMYKLAKHQLTDFADAFGSILKWTQKGRKFIYDKLAEHDIHPTLEQIELLGD